MCEPIKVQKHSAPQNDRLNLSFVKDTYVNAEKAYSRVPNKRTGLLLENDKKSHLYALIQTYTFINFQQKVPPIGLFPPILLLIFVLFYGPF